MNIAHKPKRSRSKTLAKTSNRKANRLDLQDTPFEASDVDQFKFRIVSRDGRHFFQEVRFRPPHGKEEDIRAVVDFFEGQCLEILTPEMIEAFLGQHPVAHRFEELVFDLQAVLC